MDNLHYEKFQDGTVKCIEDEIPFEVPEGWEWERLGNITTIARGGSPRPIDAYITDAEDGINWIKIGDAEKDGKYIYTTKEKIKPEGVDKSRYVCKGDFLLTNSMSFGRPYILKTDGCIHDGWLVIGNIDLIFYQDYLYYALSTDFMYQSLALLAAGSTVKNLKSDSVKTVLFPIPPIIEQKRMAVKLDELIEYINSISSDKEEFISIIENTKSKILDLAIRGKLVPQDPDDEPASVLLERIRAEKEELIKQGKIKRDKKESIIFKGDDNSYYERFSDGTEKCIDSEIPFSIPETWRFERLRNVFILNPKNITDDNTIVSFIPMTLIDDQYSGDYSYEEKIWIDCKKGYTHFKCGDVAFAKISPCFENRKSALFNELINDMGAGTTELYVLRKYTDEIDGKYLLYFLKSEYFINRGKETFSGVVGQQRIDKEVILDTLIPIPFTNVQKVITYEINKIMDCLEIIEASLI